MKLIRKFTTRLLLIIFTLLVAIICADVYLEVHGLPDSYRGGLLDEALAPHGILLDAEEVRIGFVNGLVLEGVVMRDAEAPTVRILTLPSLQIELDRWALTQGEVIPTRLVIQNATANLESAKPEHADLNLLVQDIDAEISLHPGGVDVESFSAMVEGLHVVIRGHVDTMGLGGKSNTPTDDAGSGTTASVQPLFDLIGGKHRQAIQEAREFFRSAQADGYGSLTLDVQKPAVGQMRVGFDLSFNHYFYDGLAIERLSLKGLYTPDRLRIYELRAEWDDQEYLQGDGEVDLVAGTWFGAASTRTYPTKLLKTFWREDAYGPSPLESSYMPRFQGTPPYLRVVVLPSPLAKPRDWRIDARLDATDVALSDGIFDTLVARFSYRQETIQVEESTFTIAPGTSGTASGYQRIDEGQESWWRVHVTGDPRPIAYLRDDEQFRENYLNTWKDFTWNRGAPPTLDAEIYRRRVDGTLRTLFNGHVDMRNFALREVPVEHASGDVQVDLLGKDLVISNLQVEHAGDTLSGSLHYHFGEKEDDAYIRFAVDSAINLNTLLGLCKPSWQSWPRMYRITMTGTPVISAHGFVRLKGPGVSRFDARVTAIGVKVGDTYLAHPDATVSLVDDVWTGSGTAWRIVDPDWELRGLEADHFVWSAAEGLTMKGRAGSFAFQDKEFFCPEFTLAIDDDGLRTDFDTPLFIWNAGDNPVISTDVEARNLTWDGGGMKGDFRTPRFWSPDTYEVEDADLRLQWADKTLHVSGTFGGATHVSTEATVAAADFRAVYVGDLLRAHVESERVDCLDGLLLTDVVADVEYDGTRYTSQTKLNLLNYSDEYIARNVTGVLVVEPRSVNWDAQADTFDTTLIATTGAHVIGRYDRGTWFIDHESKTLRYWDMPMTNASAKVMLQNDRVWIHDFRAGLYDGHVVGSFFSNLDDETGNVYVTGRELNLTDLQSRFSNPDSPMEQILSGQVNVTASSDFRWKGEDLLLFGDANVNIRGGELWKVPVINEFVKFASSLIITRLVLPKDGGKISSLDAYVDFEGEKAHITRIRTDGKVMRIEAQGYYWWATDGIDFLVEGKLLEKILALPLLNPFDVMLTMRLRGTPSNRSWSKGSPDWLHGKEEPVDPTLPE